MVVQLVKYLRAEKRFKSIDELKEAIGNDVLIWKEELKKQKKGH